MLEAETVWELALTAPSDDTPTDPGGWSMRPVEPEGGSGSPKLTGPAIVILSLTT